MYHSGAVLQITQITVIVVVLLPVTLEPLLISIPLSISLFVELNSVIQVVVIISKTFAHKLITSSYVGLAVWFILLVCIWATNQKMAITTVFFFLILFRENNLSIKKGLSGPAIDTVSIKNAYIQFSFVADMNSDRLNGI